MQLRHKIGYGIGDMGISTAYFALGFFYMFFLTDLVGLSPLLAGTAFFIGKLWDGVNDPLMGWICDRTRSRFGQKRVYILFGALPFALSFLALWFVPVGLGEIGKFFYAIVTLFLFSTAYTVVVVPYMALVPVLSADYDERTQITGIRSILGVVGTIFGGGAALAASRFSSELMGVRWITAFFAVFSLVTLLVAALAVTGREHHRRQPEGYRLQAYWRLIQDKNVLILLALKVIGAIGTGALTASIPYFAVHILGSTAVSTVGVAIYIVVSASFIPLWNRLSRQFDKRRLLLAANTMIFGILLLIGFAAGSPAVFYVGCLLLGIPMGAYLFIPYSFVPDLVDYYQFKTGERHESIFFGLWITVHQLGIAVSGLLLGIVLSFFGYQGDAALQTDQSLLAIRIVFALVPGFFLVLATIVLQFYEITRDYYARIRSELDQRAVKV